MSIDHPATLAISIVVVAPLMWGWARFLFPYMPEPEEIIETVVSEAIGFGLWTWLSVKLLFLIVGCVALVLCFYELLTRIFF